MEFIADVRCSTTHGSHVIHPVLRPRAARRRLYPFCCQPPQRPRFHYPAAVEDVERAVRYLGYDAKTYRIDPDRIGAVGYSSGSHLAALLGVLDGNGDNPRSRSR